jgi:hypothetical protein
MPRDHQINLDDLLHRTSAPERTVVVMVEPAGVSPTGG